MNLVKPFTKRIRAYQARKFVKDKKGKTLLDIGCGDRYFINSFNKLACIGVDKKNGGDVEEDMEYSNETFDYITMLAVIEHFKDYEKVLEKCHKWLKPNGLIIITTPMKRAKKFMRLYHRGSLEHEKYLIFDDFTLLIDFEIIHHSYFEFGLNQLIVLKCEKLSP